MPIINYNLCLIMRNLMPRRAQYEDSDDEEVTEVMAARQKPTIKLKEWLHNFKPSNSQNLKQHIMSFLLSEGLYDVAKSFSQEAGVQMPHVDENLIKQRYEIKNLIRTGDIEQALSKIKIIDPHFETSNQNNELLFSLKCLKVINLIKQGNVQQSIETAKLELLPFTKKGEKFVKQTEKVMGLLAFINIKDCPNKDLIKEEHSSKLASKINRHLLNSQQEQNDQALEALLKLGRWCEKRLSQFVTFPTINLQSDHELFKEV